MMAIHYKDAGVDIAAGNEAVFRIKRTVEQTFSKHVLTSIGGFGAMFDLKPLMDTYRHPVLVQSIDGVGTKMMVATRMQRFDTIGMDLVSATANDIIVLGAKPLTLLDYIANDQLKPWIIESIINGMAKACRENHISLIGGETAEMPGTYLKGEHDLAGVITGVLEKDQAILGHDIEAGDIICAFPSSGLHTNGYSLARHLFFEKAGYEVDHYLDELGETLGEALLKPHLNYTRPVQQLLVDQVPIKGMAHITGGGLIENMPRILPSSCALEIEIKNIKPLPIFEYLKKLSQLGPYELYQTFNMGVGLVLILAEDAWDALQKSLKAIDYPCFQIGRVLPYDGQPKVRII